ncbi:hypothetical protein QBC46DRAFT_258585 [Diplogelasinospora grovesii]|uniref:DUF7707 domain-containing protein n=1 Tax=Diplogelasinospora grovesii TaxID=303347 RepID=A0AAN6ND21_9PEZI|nr:hypothetical protein QBC46DRAFT_258585 [Diplogelasinospora grovesii]
MQKIVFAALSALTLVAAQNNFTINPAEVDPTTRSQWCNAEFNTCGILCGQSASANDCDATSLNYTCLCSNNSAPGLQYYTQTMPTFICQQAYSDCNKANVGDSIAQAKCKTDIQAKCGTLDPSQAQISSPSSSSSAAAGSATGSASASASSAPASSTHKAAAPTNVAYLGNSVAAVAAGVLAAALL